MPLYKDERELIGKNLSPKLKEYNYNVRIGVRLKGKYQKLKGEDVLSSEELNMKNPLHPDIDILYWDRDYSGEPELNAVEVKYFRFDKKKMIHPPIYDGIGEASLLCTYGVDYVHLWHFFDPEIPIVAFNQYKDIVESILTKIPTINYRCERLDIPSKPRISKDENINQISQLTKLFIEAMRKSYLTRNSLYYDNDANIIRRIIKKSFRLV